jgi:hypothetical protein
MGTRILIKRSLLIETALLSAMHTKPRGDLVVKSSIRRLVKLAVTPLRVIGRGQAERFEDYRRLREGSVCPSKRKEAFLRVMACEGPGLTGDDEEADHNDRCSPDTPWPISEFISISLIDISREVAIHLLFSNSSRSRIRIPDQLSKIF